MNKKTIRDIDVQNKKVLVRCDFNVPLDKETGNITNDLRIVAALPTIKYLLEHNAKVILCSHLGKPKGEIKPNLTLRPVAERLSEYLGFEVKFATDIVGESAKKLANELEPGKAILLENVRFDPREEANDKEFSKELADLAEIYVNDAFGTAHRAHSSTTGVAEFLPAVCGFLMEKEVKMLGDCLDNPQRPFVAILGAAKVSDKIKVIENLLEKVDTIIIGGGMTFTFLKAMGYEVGNSICELDRLDIAKETIEKAQNNLLKIQQQERQPLIDNTIMELFLLKKALYVKYMANQKILQDRHSGNTKEQRVFAKSYIDEIPFISYYTLWNL